MGLLSRSADFVYTLRFLRLLTTSFEDTTAYKLGIIDKDGKRIKSKTVTSDEEKSAYNYFHRLVFSLKRLLGKVPGGKTSLASYAAALYLVKEKLNLEDSSIEKIIKESNIEVLDFLQEKSEWFLLDDKMLSPGIYKVNENKMINSTCYEIVNKNDKIRVLADSYPVGEIFGVDVYKAIHVNSNQEIYVTVGELIK